MRILCSIVAIMLLCAPFHANAELSEGAKANEKAAVYFSNLSHDEQLTYALGIYIGMGAILDFYVKKGIEPPELMDIFSALNFCYTTAHCMHVSPRAVALSAYGKIPDVFSTLQKMEEEAVTPVKQPKKRSKK